MVRVGSFSRLVGLVGLPVMLSFGIVSSAAARVAGAPDPIAKRLKGIRKHRRDARGAVYLMNTERLSNRVAAGELDRFVSKVEKMSRLHPLVRFYLGRLKARQLDRAGKYVEAAKLRRKQGFVGQGVVVGPFADSGGSGYATEHGPEKQDGVMWSARYESRWGELRWRRLGAKYPSRDGSLRPGRIIRPLGRGVVYYAVGLRVKHQTKAAIRVGGGGSYKLWVGRTLVGSRRLSRPPGPDQDAYAVSLEAGRYIVKVKLVSDRGRWPLFLRITDLRGGRLKGVEPFASVNELERAGATMGPKGSPQSKVPFGDSVGKAVTVVGSLEKLAKKRPRDPEVARQLVNALLAVTPNDPRQGRARMWALELVELQPSPASYRLLARASRKEGDRLSALKKGLSLASGDCETLVLLARHAYERGRLRKAEERLSRCLESDPGHVGGFLLRAELLDGRGLTVLAFRLLARLAKRVGLRPDLLRQYAEAARETGRRELASRLYDKLLAHDVAHLTARRVLFQRALERLDLEDALGHLKALLRAEPYSTSLILEMTDLLAANGRVVEARQRVARALERVPRDAELQIALGRYSLAVGKTKEARRAWARALELRPQDPLLRQRLSLLEAAKPDPLVARYKLDSSTIVKQASGELPKGEDSRVLRDRTVIRVLSNGMAHQFRHRLVQIATRRGARRHSSWKVSYQPDAQRFRVVAAKVWRADGTVHQAVSEREATLSDPEVRIYYDLKERRIQFPKLRPGDVVELQMTLSDTADYSPFADYFGKVLPLQEATEKRNVEIIVEAPKKHTIYFNRPSVTGWTHSDSVKGDIQLHRWSADEIPPFRSEPDMPGWAEVAAYLHVSTFRSWGDVARWYWGLIRDQYHVDESIRRTARRITADAETVEEKVRALYRFVTRKIRYVSLAFGIHTHKPYSAPQVLARRFGDCKDKAMLLSVLLGQVGIAAHPVLVRTRPGGRIGKKPASIAVFDHAIAYVPALDRYLDGTAEFTSSTDLPFQVQGATALIIDGKGGKLTQVPVLKARKNRMKRKLTVDLKSDGSGVVRERLEMTGQLAAEWRYRFQERARRRELFEKALGRSFPGAKIIRLNMKGLEDPEQPVVVESSYRVPHLAEGSGEEKSLSLTRTRGSLVQRLAPLGKRTHPVELDFPFVSEERVELRLPSGLRAVEVPRQRSHQKRIAAKRLAFRQKVDERSNVVVLRRKLEVAVDKVTTRDYEGFRRFLAKVDAALADRFVLRAGRAGGGR
jgi:transglutaminase-like putative cysteine protease/tetratricopeptide (TPR) repeat protein